MATWREALGGTQDGVTGGNPGDPMEWLPLELATRVWPLTPSLRRKPHFWDPLHELSRTGEWTDVPRERLLDEVRRYGGYLTFGDRTFVISKQRVLHLELTREALLRPFLTEADIEAASSRARCRTRRSSSTSDCSHC